MLNFLIQRFSRQDSENNRSSLGILAGILGLISNLILFIAKIIIGSISGSVSIMADAINNLSDTASSILTLIGFKIAAKPADKDHPYGHERFEYISGFLVSILIIYVGIQFLHNSYDKIRNPEPLQLSAVIFLVLSLSILIKVWQGFMYRKVGQKIASETLRATAQDSLNDVFTTLAVLISSGVELLTGWRIDGYIGFLMALYIIYSGYQMIRKFIDELLGQRPPQTEVNQIRERLDHFPDIIGYHDLLIHSYGPTSTFASVHIEVDDTWSLTHAHEVIDTIEREIKQSLGVDLVCHLDPYPLNDEDYKRYAPVLKKLIANIDSDMKLHDLRIEKKEWDILHFDLVVPDNVKQSEEELSHYLLEHLENQFGKIGLDITFDRTYLL